MANAGDAAQQTAQIKTALMADASIDSTGIDVDTNGDTRTVTLKGHVSSAAAKTRAAEQSMDPASGAHYAALFPPSAWEGVTIERDIAYGADPLHKLDIYSTPGGERRYHVRDVH